MMSESSSRITLVHRCARAGARAGKPAAISPGCDVRHDRALLDRRLVVGDPVRHAMQLRAHLLIAEVAERLRHAGTTLCAAWLLPLSAA